MTKLLMTSSVVAANPVLKGSFANLTETPVSQLEHKCIYVCEWILLDSAKSECNENGGLPEIILRFH